MLRIIKNRKVRYMSTGISCAKELWDKEEKTVSKKHPLYKEARITIAKKIIDAERLVLNLENEDKNLSAYEIKGKLKKGKVNNALFFDYLQKVIDRFKASGQIKSSEIYKDTKRNLKYFILGGDIPFSDIDVAFLNKFEEFLKFKGKGANTIYIYLRTIRTVLNKAIKEEVCSEGYYPFKKFSLAKYANIKTEKRAITKKDMEKIAALRPFDPDVIFAQNMFLFSYYCRGMNFADICYLKWKDINNNRLTYARQKTRELFNIELLQPAMLIIEKYRLATYKTKESYIFPIFNETYTTPVSLFNRREKMIRIVNKGLKVLAVDAEIDTTLTTYVARHTYATVMRREGISTSIISQALGHDSEKTTQIYLEAFQNEIIDLASRCIL